VKETALQYDYIVVGGGTAGSVVAARLSEERDRKVLLLEAGPDYPDTIPEELLDGSAPVTSGHNWDMQAILSEEDTAPLTEQQERISKVFHLASSRLAAGESAAKPFGIGGRTGTRFQYPMGKVMGGGSAINGGLAFHARPEDYAVWAAAGNDWWSWEKVERSILRIEGADGGRPALPMETAAPEGLTRIQEAFLETCREMQLPKVDLRQGTTGGVGIIPKSFDHGRRVSMAKLYLTAARPRPNLTIQPRCLVDKIIFEAGSGAVTASGVEAIVEGRRCRFSGGQIVLAAGTINSPAILLRSQIGAALEIARIGGKAILDLPGVGKNLMDHPAVSIWAVPKAGTCLAGEPIHQVMMQQRSAPAESLCDLQLFMLSGLPTKKLPPLRDVVGAEIAMGISVILATPGSKGHVEILDNDPTRNPRIYLNCMHEADDLRRMISGLRSAWRLLRGERLASCVERIVLWNQSVIDSDNLMERVIRTTARGAWHPVGTLRMGREGDAMAVVDQRGRLYGCANVTVADGSIMPALPSVPTNLTCMLIAERIAAHLGGLEHGGKE
jgi:choline dehydrogenase